MTRTLFSYVNELYRLEKYNEALKGYELLEEINPGFPYYSKNKINIIKKLKVEKKNRNTSNAIKSNEYQKRLAMAEIFASMGMMDAVDKCFWGINDFPDFQYCLAQANACIINDRENDWLKLVNKYLKSKKMASISLKENGKNIFQRLGKSDSVISGSVEGPLVTVCMSCYNFENYVGKAIESILQQTYKNIELLVFNDCSTDKTLDAIMEAAKNDNRVKIFNNKKNQGTYVSRNEAFQMARGEFFTVLDGDDYALPERIELQVKHLQQNPSHMGVCYEWVRMDVEGKFLFKNGWGGCYQHEAVATLMLRTHQVKNDIGYWDSVKFSADTEFQFRMKKKYGKKNVPLVRTPVAISLFHTESLTNDLQTGITANGLSPVRVEYRNNWKAWHEKESELYMPYPLVERKFKAPAEMLV